MSEQESPPLTQQETDSSSYESQDILSQYIWGERNHNTHSYDYYYRNSQNYTIRIPQQVMDIYFSVDPNTCTLWEDDQWYITDNKIRIPIDEDLAEQLYELLRFKYIVHYH